ncbi:F0F1 ATP synthase subunit B [Branchiibius sp. NY16-3462-2]|uniref:F0F1 ATP synthase subunit B n=1 Tax=Branchiibius sp. NY16-3462-2 TaxID=1807500 RepID=UPI0007990BD6|nr:F0F1 ATP synthase subunit B [Branchiibius sp. NY16-3462-2]KYH45824.1 F0F1 ATP synthase subunit B [Branchiibius sp. NY16-3462-2]
MTVASLATSEGAGWPEQLPLLPHPMELLVGLISFGILYWAFAKYVVPRLEELYDKRRAAIEGGIEHAAQAQHEAEEAKAKYEAQLHDARAEAAQIREQARGQGAQIVEEARTKANEEGARLIDSAHKQIEAERQQASVQLRGEVGRLSTDLAGKIVGESLEDEARQRGIVERFLADLESGDVTPTSVGTEAGS